MVGMLDLPPEIQHLIYEDYFSDVEVILAPTRMYDRKNGMSQRLNIFLTCSGVYSVARPIFFKSSQFQVEFDEFVPERVTESFRHALPQIRHLRIENTETGWDVTQLNRSPWLGHSLATIHMEADSDSWGSTELESPSDPRHLEIGIENWFEKTRGLKEMIRGIDGVETKIVGTFYVDPDAISYFPIAEYEIRDQKVKITTDHKNPDRVLRLLTPIFERGLHRCLEDEKSANAQGARGHL